jgi:hypothetical protein
LDPEPVEEPDEPFDGEVEEGVDGAADVEEDSLDPPEVLSGDELLEALSLALAALRLSVR